MSALEKRLKIIKQIHEIFCAELLKICRPSIVQGCW